MMESKTEYVVYKTSEIEKLLTGLNNLTITGLNNSKIIVGILNILENPVSEKLPENGGENIGTN